MPGVVLVAAAVFLSLFAYRNTTFFQENQMANSNRTRPYETKDMPVPEKRGLEDLPEPVRRPVSQTTTTTQTQNERK